MFTLLIRYIHKLYIKKLSLHLMPFIHRITTISFICCFICGTLDLVDNVICFIEEDKFLHEIEIYNIVNNCVYTIILISLFALFIGRIYYTFYSSVNYALSKWFLYFVYFLIISSIACFIPAEIGYASSITFSYKISILIIIINDTLLNIMCLILFIWKIKQISFHDDLSIELLAKISSDDDDEDVEALTIINILIRHSILSTVSICFNEMWYILLFYFTFIENNDITDIQEKHLSIELCVRTFYLTINSIILYLNLNIHHHQYLKLCRFCHLKVFTICKRRQKKNKVDTNNEYSNTLLL